MLNDKHLFGEIKLCSLMQIARMNEQFFASNQTNIDSTLQNTRLTSNYSLKHV